MSSPSVLLKVNYLVMRYLYYRGVRGDLQEDHVYDKRLCGYASRCQIPLSLLPIPFLPSTKSGFLCAFALRNPSFRAFRAQNRGFCAFLAFRTPIFGHFEHKIGVFVRFVPPEPSFSDFSSTKSAFLCALVGPRPGRWPGATGATGTTGATETTEQQERRPGQFGLLTFCHKGALFKLWHSI